MNKNSIKIGQVTLNTDDMEELPSVQSFFNGKAADVYLIQPYGLTSRPPEQSALLALLSQQGNEGARLGIQFCPSLRKKGLASGEVVLENMLAGSFFYLKEDGTLEIVVPENITITTKKVTINAELVVNGQTTITGNVATTGTLTNNSKNVGSTHTHGGVTTGGGNTAAPN